MDEFVYHPDGLGVLLSRCLAAPVRPSLIRSAGFQMVNLSAEDFVDEKLCLTQQVVCLCALLCVFRYVNSDFCLKLAVLTWPVHSYSHSFFFFLSFSGQICHGFHDPLYDKVCIFDPNSI